jgi:hypothetical protein
VIRQVWLRQYTATDMRMDVDTTPTKKELIGQYLVGFNFGLEVTWFRGPNDEQQQDQLDIA